MLIDETFESIKLIISLKSDFHFKKILGYDYNMLFYLLGLFISLGLFSTVGLIVGHLFDYGYRDEGNVRADLPSTLGVLAGVLLWLYYWFI